MAPFQRCGRQRNRSAAKIQQTPTPRYEAPLTTGKIESPICADAGTAFALASLLIVNGYEHDQYMQGVCKLGRAIRQFATIDSILLVAEVGVELNREAKDQIARCGWRLCFVSTNGYQAPSGWWPKKAITTLTLRRRCTPNLYSTKGESCTVKR